MNQALEIGHSEVRSEIFSLIHNSKVPRFEPFVGYACAESVVWRMTKVIWNE